MPSDLIRAIDVSEFTTEIPPEWWVWLRETHNVQAAIIQAWGGGYIPGRRNEHFHQQARGAQDAFDGRVGCYVWPPKEWAQAWAWMGSHGPQMRVYAHDIEAGEGVGREHVDGIARAGIPEAHQLIYTSANGWRNIMADTTRFRDLPLWVARYPFDPDVSGNPVWWPDDFDGPHGGAMRYSVDGWTEPGGWQHQGTTHMHGESADLCVFRPEIFEEDDMASEAQRRVALLGARLAVEALKQPSGQLTQEEKDLLKWLAAVS